MATARCEWWNDEDVPSRNAEGKDESKSKIAGKVGADQHQFDLVGVKGCI